MGNWKFPKGIPKKQISENRISYEYIPLTNFNEIEVEDPKKIEYISLWGCDLESMEGLERFPNIERLNLDYNNISKIDHISELTHLITFKIDDNPISKIEKLETLTSLKVFHLDYCNISKIEGLENLDLQGIALYGNKIQKIEGISHMVNLYQIELYYNQIKKIQGLEGRVKLTSLSLSNNPITEIEGLAFFSKLKDFSCSAVPEFDDGYLDVIQPYGLIPLLRFICMAKIDNPLDVPDIAKILSRVPFIFSLLKGAHYEGDLVDEKPRPGQKLVPYDYEDWFFKQAGPRLTGFIQSLLDDPKYLPFLNVDKNEYSFVRDRLQKWVQILEKSKAYHKN